MFISSISSINFGNNLTKPVSAAGKKVKSELAEAAKRELEVIQKEKGQAGSSCAWWRNEFREAEKRLQEIADGKTTTDSYQSKISEFHDFGEDGFI